MKQSIIFCGPMLAGLGAVSLANAATYYAKPSGAGSTCGATSECSIGSAAGKAVAGDTVILRDGNYGKTSLSPASSGNASAWITFQADTGATPIFDGGGVGNSTSQYIRYIGIVVRYNQYGGFGNGYISTCNNSTSTSNGYLQYINCIADGNGINGIAHYCAPGLLIQQSILAHNGNGPSSWSSAVNLYGVTGGTASNVVRETVSFDTIDTSSTHSSSGKATDGSGFILDEYSQGATFINNVGFENGGSCIRLTNSSNSLLVSNTCYGNGKDPLALYNDEILYSDAASRTGASLINNAIVVTTAGKNAVGNATGVTQTNNVTNGAASFFVSVPGALNVDLNLTPSATTLIDKGTPSNAPTNDIGFDPKCIKQGTISGSSLPSWLAASSLPSWWTYVIDYAYIQQQGGVAKCFNPRTRSSAPDIGAFEYNGTAAGTSGSGGTSGGGGTSGSGGAGGDSSGTSGSSGLGGAGGNSNTAGSAATGGSSAAAGTTSDGGASASGGSTIAGGSNAMSGSTSAGTGGSVTAGAGGNVAGTAGATSSGGAAGTLAGSGTAAPAGEANASEPSACNCHVAGEGSNSRSLALVSVLGTLALALRRRRRWRAC